MTKHEGTGWWCGYDDEMPGGHVMWEPTTHSLVRRVQMNGDPTTLYRDLMGPLCDLRARMLRSARGNTEADFRNIMEAIRRSEQLQREHRAANRDVLRQTQQGSDALEQVLKLGKLLDESAMDLLQRYEKIEKEVHARRKEDTRLRILANGGAASLKEGGVESMSAGGAAEGTAAQRPKRAKKRPEGTSWKNASWDAMRGTFGKVDTLEQSSQAWAKLPEHEKMFNNVDVTGQAGSCTVYNKSILHTVMHLLATGDADDVRKLKESEIFSDDADINLEFSAVALESWRSATNYNAPRHAVEAMRRTDGEGAEWTKSICKELDWFLEHDKVVICHADDLVPLDEIPPYAWLEKTLTDLGLKKYVDVTGMREKLVARLAKGGTIDEVFDILDWVWVFARKMESVLNELGKPTGQQVFKKGRARCCLKGCAQREMRTYDPMMVAAAVVHPASLHLVNIIIVCFNLHIMKIDDPKAFCQGDLLYPIYATVPPGIRNMEKYAPWGKKTRWKVLGAIYGLIQASLKYFIKSSEHCRPSALESTTSQGDTAELLEEADSLVG